MGGGGGLFDFRVTQNPNLCWMFNLDVEFDNNSCVYSSMNNAVSSSVLAFLL